MERCRKGEISDRFIYCRCIDMKIGILTFHNADNFGAVLQNYALQVAIDKLGFEAFTINYRCKRIESDYILHPKYNGRNPISAIRFYLIQRLNLKAKSMQKEKYSNFRKKYIKIEGNYNNSTIDSVNKKYGVIIVGSDQVWNSNLVNSEDDSVYSLGFATGKTGAYAASSGDISQMAGHVLSNIIKIGYITVRELSLYNELSQHGIRCGLVCDPVFLIDREQWDSLICEDNLHKNYIFMYTVGEGKVIVNEIIKYISKRKNLPIHIVDSCPIFKQRNFIYNTDAGPIDFLQEIRNADFVVASSFHGVAFSIIFNKQFIAIPHPITGGRITELLKKIGLEDYIVSSLEEYKEKEKNLKKINYSEVNFEINKWKKESFLELKKICDQ